ncbi:MAG: ABC transporter ATP-binding protein [Desulfosarcinaceae bacterium]
MNPSPDAKATVDQNSPPEDSHGLPGNPNRAPIIDLEKITFAYPGRQPVLRDLDLHFHAGEKIGLVAPNGSGKTTLFHIIMGLLKPECGRVSLFGKERLQEKDFIEVRRRIGLLFQDADDQLFSPTVIEDVAFGPLNLGQSRAQARATAEKTLADLGLEAFADRITHQLSGGEKRLVSLATVLAMAPEVLLLDEPTNGLDTDTRRRIVEILKTLEISFILISHNLDFLSQLTDQIYTLADGRILTDQPMAAHQHTHIHSHGTVPHEH